MPKWAECKLWLRNKSKKDKPLKDLASKRSYFNINKSIKDNYLNIKKINKNLYKKLRPNLNKKRGKSLYKEL